MATEWPTKRVEIVSKARRNTWRICAKWANWCFGRGQNNAFAHFRLDVRFDGSTSSPSLSRCHRACRGVTEPDFGEPHPMGPLHQKRTRFQARVVAVPPTRLLSE